MDGLREPSHPNKNPALEFSPGPEVESCRVTRKGRARVVARIAALAVAVAVGAGAPVAFAEPWSQLPDAIDRLSQRSDDEDAEQVLILAEASIVNEVQAGRLVAARTLFDTYASLVSNLPSGSFRLRVVGRRIALRFLAYGNAQQSTDLHRAAASWALAGELDPQSEAVDRLRSVLLPPEDAEPGQVWRAPLDGAAMVFHPAMAIRLGCTVNDGDCRNNEVFFRWVEVPARWVDSREVSNRRYRRCVEAGSCTIPENPVAYNDSRRSEHPVVGVSWRQARAYARWAGRRLPSEAEWERAARGEITEIRFPWGNKRMREYANVWLEPRDAVDGSTTPVGNFPSLGYGLKDMSGNVWEWCEDRFQPRFTSASDDGGAARDGRGRVVRGGSWRRAIDMARVSTRSWFDIGYHADDLGFRCVMDHQSTQSAERLVRTALRAFPVAGEVGHELVGAELDTEDRRYLERRALTLFVVEGRTDEALLPAARRLDLERADPVAKDIFARFETELLQAASLGKLQEVHRGLEAYRMVVEKTPRLTGRFASFERQLVMVLRQTVTNGEKRGDRDSAAAAAEIGLEVSGSDAVFAAAVERLRRATGEAMIWDGDGKGMIWVAGRDFLMGAGPGDGSANENERPVHRVTVDGFWIDRTEVTNDEYRSCVRAGACSPPHRSDFFEDPKMGSHPVVSVDWYQARDYAKWAGKRLPTEAEWELAARDGAKAPYPWGTSWVPGSGNAIGTYREDGWSGTAPVASFEPSGWGIYDLIGNASEWVEDVFNETYFGAPLDGAAWWQETGLGTERRHVVRGGGYDDPPQRQRATRRAARRPDDFNRSVGFRCVTDE